MFNDLNVDSKYYVASVKVLLSNSYLIVTFEMSAWYFIKQLWYSDMADVIIIKDKHKHYWPLIKVKIRKV